MERILGIIMGICVGAGGVMLYIWIDYLINTYQPKKQTQNKDETFGEKIGKLRLFVTPRDCSTYMNSRSHSFTNQTLKEILKSMDHKIATLEEVVDLESYQLQQAKIKYQNKLEFIDHQFKENKKEKSKT